LLIVSALASRWGVEATDTGKRVWVEVLAGDNGCRNAVGAEPAGSRNAKSGKPADEHPEVRKTGDGPREVAASAKAAQQPTLSG
jgi:hypothetical protein